MLGVPVSSAGRSHFLRKSRELLEGLKFRELLLHVPWSSENVATIFELSLATTVSRFLEHTCLRVLNMDPLISLVALECFWIQFAHKGASLHITLGWFTTPIAIWFSLVLCAFSVSLAFLAPYTLYASPVSPCTLEVSSHPGQPPVAECVAVQIAEASTPATYHDVYSADFGSNAFISTSTSMSIQSPAVHESPSMNLSALLAETDPCADMSALLNLEMKFVPEIYVTLADDSAQISRLSERHFEFSRSLRR